MFGKSKAGLNKRIVGFTKARKILFFTIKPKPIYESADKLPTGTLEMESTGAGGEVLQFEQATKTPSGKKPPVQSKMMKDLGPALVEIGMKISPEQYVKSCTQKAAMAAGAMLVISAIIVLVLNLGTLFLIFSPVAALIAYFVAYSILFSYPLNKIKSSGDEIERDVLFAARDMIVSMRSGVPLFNAMATVSVGYGAASREFEKIIDRVQLGMPMDQAIDEVSSKSRSQTFKKLMLQASTSIKVGADVVNAIQEVINDVSQERVIELRRYGQRLNAIAMFYMLFGVIFPSMGIAVAAIMTTFISIFAFTSTTLIIALVGLGFLQFVFLKLVSGSRPSFAA
ncbi:MAG: type II secretion system F family protein [Candidatus Micrarchaeota archaeon]|nr:type II secretion system F family protein [Candidatus Micrarchaeota archaeon]MDE1859379.1 type II secretion system F family protein [Candidatus Micrarchaeota archaeon]